MKRLLWVNVLLLNVIVMLLLIGLVPQAEEPTVATLVPTLTPSPVFVPSATAQAPCMVSTGIKDGISHVRTGPGQNHDVVDMVREGETLIPFGDLEHGWQRVRTPRGIIGWFFIVLWCK
jgi:uncharacterized protein YgiM (DUF1202 family)